MRFVTILVVLAVLGWLGQKQLTSGHVTSAPQAQSVVNGARTKLQQVDTSGQAGVDRAIANAENQP